MKLDQGESILYFVYPTDELGDTQPTVPRPAISSDERSMDEYQPIRVGTGRPLPDIRRGEHRRRRWGRWVALVLILIYFLLPFRTNVLILGVDDSPTRGPVGRSDTIILSTITPYYTGLLGIPRDLWVRVPGVGDQRINTAYFFAEAQQRGSGPAAAVNTIRQVFGVGVSNYLVVHMTGVSDFIDSLGGVDVPIRSPMAGYGQGTYHFDGTQALAFARERYSSDDFSRMKQGQILILAVLKKLLSPAGVMHIIPAMITASQTIDTDIPFWLYPRLAVAMLRAAIFGLDGRTITREMVVPFKTDQGAQVLGPNWDAINPVLKQVFGQ